MYLGKTRAKLTRQGGGLALKPNEGIARLRAEGYFLELWQVRLNPGKPASPQTAIIFDTRAYVTSVISAEGGQAEPGKWSVTLSGKLDGGPGLIDFILGTI